MKNSSILKITIPVFAVAVCLLTVAQAIALLPCCDVVVEIDLKPGSCPNCVNPDSRGRVAVAILGSETFDVAGVDISTILFQGAAPNKRCSVEDVNGDGLIDLVCHFKTQDVADEDEWPQGAACQIVTLTANLKDGTLFVGTDLACKPGEEDCNNEICPLDGPD